MLILEECPEMCIEVYQPVCGSNGKTYGNKCKLGVDQCKVDKNLRVIHEGECKKPSKSNITLSTNWVCHSVQCPPR